MSLSAGNNQSATVNTAVATAPSVLVTDAYNNPVSGVSVTFAVGLRRRLRHRRLGDHQRLGYRHARQLDAGDHRRRQHADGDQRRAQRLAGDVHGDRPGRTGHQVRGDRQQLQPGRRHGGHHHGAARRPVRQPGGHVGDPRQVQQERHRRLLQPRRASGPTPAASRRRRSTPAARVGRVYTITARSTSGGTRTGTSAAVTTVAGAPTRISLSAGNNQTATAGRRSRPRRACACGTPTATTAPEWSSPSPWPRRRLDHHGVSDDERLRHRHVRRLDAGHDRRREHADGDARRPDRVAGDLHGDRRAGAATKYLVTSSSYTPSRHAGDHHRASRRPSRRP